MHTSASATKIQQPFDKATLAQAREIQRLLREYDGLAPLLRRAFLESARQLSNSVDVNAVAALLADHRIDQAVSLVQSRLPSQAFRPLGNAIATGILKTGERTAQNVGIADFSFGVTNPKTLEFIQRYEGGLIRELTAQTRASVMTAIRAGVQAGQNPLDSARDVRDLIGLTRTQVQAVKNYRRSLQDASRSALDRGLRDRRFDPSVARAASSGSPLGRQKIDQLVERYRQRYLKYRSETIARTESIRAVNAGNHLSWQQMVADGKLDADQIRRKWVYTHDSKTRPAHREIPDMNPDGVGLNDFFNTSLGPLLYPGDHNGAPENTINCRCTVIYRFKYKDHG